MVRVTLRDQLGKPVLFHVVLWHAKDGAPSLTGYDSRDPNVISHQLKAMQALGGQGAGLIALTYGPTVSPFIHEACMNMCNQANALGMPFALCFDPWTVKAATNKDAAMIAALQNPDIQFLLGCDNYLPGKPVLDFATGCDAVTVKAAVPGIEYWMNGVDYDWVRIPSTPNKTNLPCTFIEFNDGTGPNRNMQVWNQSLPCRIVPSLAGNTFYGRNVSAGQYVQFLTWNDYAETTQIEPLASMLWGKI